MYIELERPDRVLFIGDDTTLVVSARYPNGQYVGTATVVASIDRVSDGVRLMQETTLRKDLVHVGRFRGVIDQSATSAMQPGDEYRLAITVEAAGIVGRGTWDLRAVVSGE